MMKHSLNKWVASLFMLFLLYFSAAGCARLIGYEPAHLPEGIEPIEFVVWVGWADPGVVSESDLIHRYIFERLGVDIRFEYTKGDARDRLNLFAATGDYPDAIFNKDNEILRRMAFNGHLLELTGYIEKHAPLLYEVMVQLDTAFQYLPEEPGKYYFVPGGFGYSQENPLIEPMLGFRHDVWTAIGKPRPKTVEDFFQMAKDMQDVHPEEDGVKTYSIGGWFGDDWGQWAPYAIQRYAGLYGWWYSSDSNRDWNIQYAADSEPWIYAMRLLNGMYREGYGDPEAAVMRHDAYMEKLRKGLILCNYYGGSWMDGNANAARISAGKPEQRMIPWPYMTYADYSGQPLTGQYFPAAGHYNLYITRNCQNPAEVIKRLAWLYSDEGQVLTGMGIEGIHWTLDESGRRRPADAIIQGYREDAYFVEHTGIGKYRLFGYKMGWDDKGDAYDLPNNYYLKTSSYDRIDWEILEDLGASSYEELAKAGKTRLNNFLGNYLGMPHGTEQDILMTEMERSVAEYTALLYIARTEEEFEERVLQWQKRMEDIGYRTVIEELNRRVAEQVRKSGGKMW